MTTDQQGLSGNTSFLSCTTSFVSGSTSPVSGNTSLESADTSFLSGYTSNEPGNTSPVSGDTSFLSWNTSLDQRARRHRRNYRPFFLLVPAFARFCCTRSFTMRSIRSYGIGWSSGNRRLPFSPA